MLYSILTFNLVRKHITQLRFHLQQFLPIDKKFTTLLLGSTVFHLKFYTSHIKLNLDRNCLKLQKS